MPGRGRSGGPGGAPLIVLVGPAGSGKTTVGRALAGRLGRTFVDADEFHDGAARRAMAQGRPLTDAEREPWLVRVRGRLAQALARDRPVVLACSALGRRHRRALVPDGAGSGALAFVGLDVPRAVLAARVASRPGHFFPASLVDTQLEAFEPPAPEEGWRTLRVDATAPVDRVVEAIVAGLTS